MSLYWIDHKMEDLAEKKFQKTEKVNVKQEESLSYWMNGLIGIMRVHHLIAACLSHMHSGLETISSGISKASQRTAC